MDTMKDLARTLTQEAVGRFNAEKMEKLLIAINGLAVLIKDHDDFGEEVKSFCEEFAVDDDSPGGSDFLRL